MQHQRRHFAKPMKTCIWRSVLVLDDLEKVQLCICTRGASNEMNQIDNHDSLQVSFGLKCSQVQRQTERVASIT